MPNAIQLLKQDHRKVEQLFEQFEALQDRTIAMKVCEELHIHTQLEEELVYPELARIDQQLEQDAEREHDEADTLIAEIESLGSGRDDRLWELMTKLKGAIQHHVSEEEQQAFPKLEQNLGSTLDRIGADMENRRLELVEGDAAMATQGGGGATPRLIDLTKEELYAKAQAAGIKGRSQMTKDQLADALSRS